MRRQAVIRSTKQRSLVEDEIGGQPIDIALFVNRFVIHFVNGFDTHFELKKDFSSPLLSSKISMEMSMRMSAEMSSGIPIPTVGQEPALL